MIFLFLTSGERKEERCIPEGNRRNHHTCRFLCGVAESIGCVQYGERDLGSRKIIDKRHRTHSGDIVLYYGDQIVMFYGSNSWSYTRLAHVDDLSGWEAALGSGDIQVTFTIE